MDRWFLSQKEVIAASRKFVCVRMMTYESAAEAQVLKALWRPGAALENTVFAILDPYGRQLTHPARSPRQMYRDAYEMAAGLNQIADEYGGRGSPQRLPTVASVRLGMNVAACDKRPLAVVVASSEQDRKEMENTLAQLAWSSDFIGKVVYASGSRQDVASIDGGRTTQGYLFISPNEFGSAGTVLEQLPATASSAQLASALRGAIERHQPTFMDHREHIRLGHQYGVQWHSAIPITDPHELQAFQHHQSSPPHHGGYANQNYD